MKKLLLFLFLSFTPFVFGQINLTGDAKYKLNIVAYMDRGNDGCGDIDGLRYIRATRADGSTFDIWSGRRIYEAVEHEVNYNKSNPIVHLEFMKVIRWDTTFGCNGGPDNRTNNIGISNTCFAYYSGIDAGDGLKTLTVTSKPYVKIDAPTTPLYLGDTDALNITLPDNIGYNYYNWQYQVGNGPVQTIPAAYNNSNILNINASNFLTPADLGKTVSVWVNMNCTAGHQLAKGYAKRDAFWQYQACIRECFRGSFSQIIACMNGCRDTFNQTSSNIDNNPPAGLTAQYQSINSNAISFLYLMSAPKIVSKQVTPTSCFDTTDGTLVLNFDRNVISGETVSLTLQNTSNQGSSPISYNNITLDTNNSYTISNLEAGNYELKVFGGYNGTVTYSSTVTTPVTFTINKPAPVDFNLTKTNVWCNGGNDGIITINATGGNVLDANSGPIRYFYSLNNGNWLPFSSETTHTLSNLLPGSFSIKVKDYRDCIAKTPQGAEKILTEVITEPSSPVSLTYTEVFQPTFYGGTNGRIVAAITGGTRNLDNSYDYEWKNSAGVIQTNVTPYYDAVNHIYNLTLNGIPSDTYTLTIKDRNFSSATHQVGCAVLNSQQFLDQPDPLVVTFSVQKTISCHVSNAFGDETDFNPTDGQRDESQDGVLVANVTGGVAFSGFENNGLPYKYFWKKQLPNGSWVAWNDQDETAQNLSHGNYSLNIEDKNGIKLGTYVNNQLSQEIDVTYFMAQPAKLELSFQKGDITCSSGNNGWAKVTPTGGTAPYTYEWTTGDSTDTLNNLMANNYFVKITDAKGCFVQGSITIDQPNGVQINEVSTNPSCFGGNDGTIQIQIVGGTQPYQYSWSTGATSQNISNLTEGTYTVTVVDAQGCTYYKSHTLTNPAQITVDLGADRVLCNGQSQDLDITIQDSGAQYEWTSTNSFTSNQPIVSLTNPGTYHAKITSSLGCIAEDDIVITTSQVNIASEFFLSTQAYLDEEVILVNTSNPLGQNTTWVIPANVTVVTQNDNYTVLKFNALGAYTISLKQTQGDCYALYSKVINVEQRSVMPNIGNTSNPFITEFTITPNPNNGNFNAVIKIQENSPIKLRLYALSGQQSIMEESGDGQKSYVIPFNTNLSAGIYAMVLETAKQTLIKKIVIY